VFDDKIFILDGATGTELIRAGMPRGVTPELWVLEHPEVLLKIQQSYIEAGSDVLYAPTFGANAMQMKRHGYDGDIRRLNYDLAALTRSCNPRCMAGSIGSCGGIMRPAGDLSYDDLYEIFLPQIQGLMDAGVDYFAIETMMDLKEARAVGMIIKSVCDIPFTATFSVDAGGRTVYGTSLAIAMLTMSDAGAAAVGLNCSTGPENMAEFVREAAGYADIPMIIKPNAGLPKTDEHNNVYFDMSPEDFAAAMAPLPQYGVTMVGGCCGTDNRHIKALAKAMSSTEANPGKADNSDVVTSESETAVYCGGATPLPADGDMPDKIYESPYVDENVLLIKIIDEASLDYLEELLAICRKPMCFICAAELEDKVRKVYTGKTKIVISDQ